MEGTEQKERKRGFFSRTDWLAFWIATVVSFAVYFFTLAPTVTLEDSGELAVAGDWLGVPHPPGYPLWSTLAFIFARIFSFVTFRGQPNPAWGIALMSAFFGALASGIAAMLVCRSGADMLRRSKQIAPAITERSLQVICCVSGVVSSLIFAFSPVMWSQAVIVEVYTLNAFFLVIIFLLTYRWMCEPSDRVLYATAFLFGLGLTNYQALLLAALPLAVAVAMKDNRLFRDFLVIGIPMVAVIGLIKMGNLPAIAGPRDPTTFVYLTINVVAIAMAYFFLPRGKVVALSILLAELGLAYYVYMPIVSELRRPLPMNWGYPRTWEGFVHAVMRRQYDKISFHNPVSMHFVRQIGFYLSDLRGQFTLPVVMLGFLPFTAWELKVGGRRISAMYVAIVLSILIFAMVLAEELILPTGIPVFSMVYKLMVAGILLLLGTGSVLIMAQEGMDMFDRVSGKGGATTPEKMVDLLTLVGVLGAYAVYAVTLSVKIIEVLKPLRLAEKAVDAPTAGRLVLESMGLGALILFPFVAVSLLCVLARGKHEMRVSIDGISRKWIITTMFGFLAMGIVFINLANLQMDIQDTVIQKVKFISSHALFGFWIGYGLVLGLATADNMFRKSRFIRAMSIVTAVLITFIPIQQNAYSRELIRTLGGSEQNGHDFGWQFGNYQLRGAEAILEELDPGEEPPPDPTFPPAMEHKAVFYGGTDPGRFVPTYMIYSADVRPDIYLITQNALADPMYLCVMRDLYGDKIWMPAKHDSQFAFQRYVREVDLGLRPRNSEIVVENDRVQVCGALGVMEINGIVAQMIFEKNNYRTAFYVEESYVIPWMFDYMEPHGLILKVNSSKGTVSKETVVSDMDFWDWYTRRLEGDRKFKRDVFARKSFSKLRTAIAGYYENRNMFDVAERAFHEARILYPLSPESSFRLAKDVLMTLGRFGYARQIISDLGERDPGSDKPGMFIADLNRYEGMRNRIVEIEKSPVDMPLALELSDLYMSVGMMDKFFSLAGEMMKKKDLPAPFFFQLAHRLMQARSNEMAEQALDMCLEAMDTNTPPEHMLSVVEMYSRVGKNDKVESLLARYLRLQPENWNAWLNLCAVRTIMRDLNGAEEAMKQAITMGGAQALSVINQEQVFAEHREKANVWYRSLGRIPGLGPVRTPVPRP